MHENKPDAIRCGEMVYYADNHSATQSEYRSIDGNSDNYVTYKADGSFDKRSEELSGSAGCEEKSLTDLYDSSLAYNFVSNKPNEVTGENTAEKTNDWPYALNCATDKNDTIIFYLQQTSFYIANDAKYKY